MTVMAEQASAVDTTPKLSRIKAIVAASSGNLVEWYDFYAYAFTSIYFASAFFPSGDQTSQLLATAGIFAVGFFMRPLGGWLFGWIADTHGRKNSMVLSVLLMCAGSLMIGILPTYQSIGTMAPALLLVARMAQGLSVGGEYGTAATYMSEVAGKGSRGFYSSFQYVTLVGGQLLALFVVVILQQVLSPDELKQWGWRIPFFIGALAAIVAMYLRRSLHETASAETMHHKEAGSLLGLWHHKLVSTIMTAALIVFMLLQPVFGSLSDRIGRRSNMILFSGFATLAAVPLLTVLSGTTDSYVAFGLIMIGLVIACFYTSISGVVKAELFPAEVRALGVGLPYAVANALFGGTAEFVALSLKSQGIEYLFFWYVAVMAFVALVASIWMPDTRTNGYLEGSGRI